MAGAVEPAARARAKPEDSAPPLPPLEELTPESDFSPFMRANVDETIRRAALRKLFADPHFNVPDPWEAYSIDFTQAEPVPQEMLKALAHARRVLFEEEPAKAAEAQPAGSDPAAAAEPTPAGAPGGEETGGGAAAGKEPTDVARRENAQAL